MSKKELKPIKAGGLTIDVAQAIGTRTIQQDKFGVNAGPAMVPGEAVQFLEEVSRLIQQRTAKSPYARRSGSTATFGVVSGNELTIATLGDSPAFLLVERPDGVIEKIELTRGHGLRSAVEQEALMNRGGIIVEHPITEDGRVLTDRLGRPRMLPRTYGIAEMNGEPVLIGGNQLGGAYGNANIPAITQDLRYTRVDLRQFIRQPHERCKVRLVIGSDVLTEKTDLLEYTDVLRAALKRPGSSDLSVANEFLNYAYGKGAGDNGTAMVVELPIPKPGETPGEAVAFVVADGHGADGHEIAKTVIKTLKRQVEARSKKVKEPGYKPPTAKELLRLELRLAQRESSTPVVVSGEGVLQFIAPRDQMAAIKAHIDGLGLKSLKAEVIASMTEGREVLQIGGNSEDLQKLKDMIPKEEEGVYTAPPGKRMTIKVPPRITPKAPPSVGHGHAAPDPAAHPPHTGNQPQEEEAALDPAPNNGGLNEPRRAAPRRAAAARYTVGTPEREGLLDAIRKDPHDDLPRLAYADWLDDHGFAERSEFIRTQIKLAQLKKGDPEHDELMKRQDELLKKHGRAWAEEDLLEYFPREDGVRRGRLNHLLINPADTETALLESVRQLYRRHYPVFQRGFATGASVPDFSLRTDWEHSPIRRLLEETTVQDIRVMKSQSLGRNTGENGDFTMLQIRISEQELDALLPRDGKDKCLAHLRTLDLGDCDIVLTDAFAKRLASAKGIANLQLVKGLANRMTDEGVGALLQAAKPGSHLQHTVIELGALANVSPANQQALHEHNERAKKYQQQEMEGNKQAARVPRMAGLGYIGEIDPRAPHHHGRMKPPGQGMFESDGLEKGEDVFAFPARQRRSGKRAFPLFRLDELNISESTQKTVPVDLGSITQPKTEFTAPKTGAPAEGAFAAPKAPRGPAAESKGMEPGKTEFSKSRAGSVRPGGSTFDAINQSGGMVVFTAQGIKSGIGKMAHGASAGEQAEGAVDVALNTGMLLEALHVHRLMPRVGAAASWGGKILPPLMVAHGLKDALDPNKSTGERLMGGAHAAGGAGLQAGNTAGFIEARMARTLMKQGLSESQISKLSWAARIEKVQETAPWLARAARIAEAGRFAAVGRFVGGKILGPVGAVAEGISVGDALATGKYDTGFGKIDLRNGPVADAIPTIKLTCDAFAWYADKVFDVKVDSGTFEQFSKMEQTFNNMRDSEESLYRPGVTPAYVPGVDAFPATFKSYRHAPAWKRLSAKMKESGIDVPDTSDPRAVSKALKQLILMEYDESAVGFVKNEFAKTEIGKYLGSEPGRKLLKKGRDKLSKALDLVNPNGSKSLDNTLEVLDALDKQYGYSSSTAREALALLTEIHHKKNRTDLGVHAKTNWHGYRDLKNAWDKVKADYPVEAKYVEDNADKVRGWFASGGHPNQEAIRAYYQERLSTLADQYAAVAPELQADWLKHMEAVGKRIGGPVGKVMFPEGETIRKAAEYVKEAGHVAKEIEKQDPLHAHEKIAKSLTALGSTVQAADRKRKPGKELIALPQASAEYQQAANAALAAPNNSLLAANRTMATAALYAKLSAAAKHIEEVQQDRQREIQNIMRLNGSYTMTFARQEMEEQQAAKSKTVSVDPATDLQLSEFRKSAYSMLGQADKQFAKDMAQLNASASGIKPEDARKTESAQFDDAPFKQIELQLKMQDLTKRYLLQRREIMENALGAQESLRKTQAEARREESSELGYSHASISMEAMPAKSVLVPGVTFKITADPVQYHLLLKDISKLIGRDLTKGPSMAGEAVKKQEYKLTLSEKEVKKLKASVTEQEVNPNGSLSLKLPSGASLQLKTDLSEVVRDAFTGTVYKELPPTTLYQRAALLAQTLVNNPKAGLSNAFDIDGSGRVDTDQEKRLLIATYDEVKKRFNKVPLATDAAVLKQIESVAADNKIKLAGLENQAQVPATQTSSDKLLNRDPVQKS
jgi:uncharacterized protein (TIGR02996 family)